MDNLKSIPIQDYQYELPPERIALQPLPQRDDSKLLVYRNQGIEHTVFRNLSAFLPTDSFLVFNDTKVIPARILFQKDSGAEIEIFLLNPTGKDATLATTMAAQTSCRWQCTIGNLKRWKDTPQSLLKKSGELVLIADLVNRNEGTVELRWNTTQTFAEVVARFGVTPLPPYIRREASHDDVERYQTIYSHYEGAVAAPTAGLHFTDRVFKSLTTKGIQHDFVTLHVSAGTFQPVKTQNALDHSMHNEQVVVTRSTIANLIKKDQNVIAVGTTSMRTLESLYWYGVKLLENEEAVFEITQHDPYGNKKLPAPEDTLQAVVSYMDKHRVNSITGQTSIYIYPGYSFKVCKGLITNFHLPGSTLMLLVAAFVGPHWKKIYKEALDGDYRFLSYGDSSLLIP